ncbi:MAG TPA: hypothetical protein VH253_13625 [Phycisphaerae bacterium]|nr:hypothetical protein [Phycisphaerae bacterium]
MPSPHLLRLWDTGQRLLALGRYVPARTALEAAESLAWRRRDPASLARLYLPLLEARRQIRYQAVEGQLLICNPSARAREERQQLNGFLHAEAGTVLLTCAAGEGQSACRFSGSVQFAARRTARPLEALLLIRLATDVRIAAQPDPTFAAGLSIDWTKNPAAPIPATTTPNLRLPLPPPGLYDPANPLHPLARESLLAAWEALALTWQTRHPPPHFPDAWQELAWLRLALRIDPACEPITMRLLALAESLERAPNHAA